MDRNLWKGLTNICHHLRNYPCFSFNGVRFFFSNVCVVQNNLTVTITSHFKNILIYISVSGTGTFGRVLLCKNKETDQYGAMKILCLADVIRLKQVEHVKNEKHILEEIRHPFIVNL